MISFSLDWQYNRTAFVINNESPLDIADAVLNDASGEVFSILDNVAAFSCIWLADALLVCYGCDDDILYMSENVHFDCQIWRCYILWEGKRWVLLPLPILLIVAIGKFIDSFFCTMHHGSL